jgi:DNA repair protein RecO (recombination protein O)
MEGYSFSAVCGGILCDKCKAKDRGAVRLNTSTLYALQYIISKDVEKLFTFAVTDEVLKELTRCVSDYMDCCIGHEFKALESIKSLSVE